MGPRSARDSSFFCSVNSIRDNTFVRLRVIKRRETRERLCMGGRGQGKEILWQFIFMESQRVWPEKFNRRGRTHPECGQPHPIDWGPKLGERRKWAEFQHASLSASCLWIRCDQLPHAPAVILPCHGGWHPKTVTTMNPFFLTFLLPATWSQQGAEERAQLPHRGATSCYLRQEREMINLGQRLLSLLP